MRALASSAPQNEQGKNTGAPNEKRAGFGDISKGKPCARSVSDEKVFVSEHSAIKQRTGKGIQAEGVSKIGVKQVAQSTPDQRY